MTIYEQSFESFKQGMRRALSDIESRYPNEVAYLEIVRDAVEQFCSLPAPTDFDGMMTISMAHTQTMLTLNSVRNGLRRKSMLSSGGE